MRAARRRFISICRAGIPRRELRREHRRPADTSSTLRAEHRAEAHTPARPDANGSAASAVTTLTPAPARRRSRIEVRVGEVDDEVD